MSDRGAKALGELLYRQLGQFGYDRLFSAHQHEHLEQEARSMAKRIVGVDDEYGRTDPHTSLFIPDVSEHEPKIVGEMGGGPFSTWLECQCGWTSNREPVGTPESYFDHLSEPITESEQRLLDGNR